MWATAASDILDSIWGSCQVLDDKRDAILSVRQVTGCAQLPDPNQQLEIIKHNCKHEADRHEALLQQ